MTEMLRYVNMSIKPDVASKIRELAKVERHTLSDELEIITEFYVLKNHIKLKETLSVV
jgi:hypothetical protein